jgi:hypothetical protein
VAGTVEHHHGQRHARIDGAAERLGIQRLQTLHGGVEIARHQHAHRLEAARGEQRLQHRRAQRTAAAGNEHAVALHRHGGGVAGTQGLLDRIHASIVRRALN